MEPSTSELQTPHQGGLVRTAGEPLITAHAAMLLVHGRGASAGDILSLTEEFNVEGFAYIAPQAAGNTWYPNRFLAPVESNEPWLSSALAFLDEIYARLTDSLPPEQIIFLGFSQGACLALEYAARHPRRYGGLVGLSGALIGPPDSPHPYTGSLNGTPVFLGCSDVDPHVPKESVEQTAERLTALGGQVTTRLYPGLGHQVNQDELDFIRGLMQECLGGV
jgi:predicted esterase